MKVAMMIFLVATVADSAQGATVTLNADGCIKSTLQTNILTNHVDCSTMMGTDTVSYTHSSGDLTTGSTMVLGQSGFIFNSESWRAKRAEVTQTAVASAAEVKFKLDVPMYYNISGSSTFTNTPYNESYDYPASAQMQIVLKGPESTGSAAECNVDVCPFYSFSRSDETMDESFTAGVTGGDMQNVLIGSLSGWLDANTEYTFKVYTLSAGNIAGEVGVEANFELQFVRDANAASVPVLSPLAMILAGSSIGLLGFKLVSRG